MILNLSGDQEPPLNPGRDSNAYPGIEFHDRSLAHLQIVIKLRRGESFGVCFDHGPIAGSGRTTIWLSPAIPLQFIYLGSKEPAINELWLESLAASSNSAAGLRVIAEPPQQLDL
jgi:hypothetical protein